MPVYVYECSKCGKTFEFEQRIVEDPLTACRLCSANGMVKRLIQPTAIMFKGSGFYVNDSQKAAPAAEEKPATEPTKTETAKAETPKPEPVAETAQPAATTAAKPKTSS